MRYQGLIWHLLWGTDAHKEAFAYYQGNKYSYKDLPKGLEQACTFRDAIGRGWSPLNAFWQAHRTKWVIRAKHV